MISNLEIKFAIWKAVGSNIEARREFLSISRAALAETMGISYQQLYKYEKGQNRLGVDQIFFLRRYLDLSYNELFDGLEQ